MSLPRLAPTGRTIAARKRARELRINRPQYTQRMKTTARLACLLLALALLAACGTKGPLVLPPANGQSATQ